MNAYAHRANRGRGKVKNGLPLPPRLDDFHQLDQLAGVLLAELAQDRGLSVAADIDESVLHGRDPRSATVPRSTVVDCHLVEMLHLAPFLDLPAEDER